MPTFKAQDSKNEQEKSAASSPDDKGGTDKDFPALTLKGRSFSENVNNISNFKKQS